MPNPKVRIHKVGQEIADGTTITTAVTSSVSATEFIEGKVKLTIPAGTQPGKVFRLRGKGIQNLRGYGQGDQLVVVQIHVPSKPKDEEKKLLEEYAKLLKVSPAKKKGFF